MPELKAAVFPNHPYFGKRPVKTDGFYEALRREDVTFRRNAVVGVDETGIIDDHGLHTPVGVIILATGFNPAEYLPGLDVVGRDGASLQQFWAGRGGPEAFLGISVPGFPNFFMLYGPNTNMGQIVFNLETQSRYIARTLVWMRRRRLRVVDVRVGAYEVFNRWLQRALSRTVWPGTDNYLKAHETEKLVVPFPHAMLVYWGMTRLFRRGALIGRRGQSAPAWIPPWDADVVVTEQVARNEMRRNIAE
jgi:cation diffusion facilitator CzcD-associated flavoprotein CzcO